MIFAAGLGTRYKPWTDSHPKALAVINGKSLLQRNIEYLQQHGIENIVVNVHHFSGQIKEVISVNKGWGSNIIISDETNEVLETGGGLWKAKDLLKDKGTFITLNADILTDLDLAAFYMFHKSTNALISLAVTDRVTSRYLLFDMDDRLCGWRNTKTGEEKIPVQNKELFQKAYSGITLFEEQIFDLIPQRGKFSLIDTFLSLAADQQIMGFDHSGGKFIDVGKPENVSAAEKLFK